MCQPRGAVAGGLIQDLDNCSVMAVDCEDRRYCFQITTPNGKSYVSGFTGVEKMSSDPTPAWPPSSFLLGAAGPGKTVLCSLEARTHDPLGSSLPFVRGSVKVCLWFREETTRM